MFTRATFRFSFGLLLGGLAVIACSSSPTSKKAKHVNDAGDFEQGVDPNPSDPAKPPDYVNEDAGIFGAQERELANGQLPDGGRDENHNDEIGTPVSGRNYCGGALGPGDLAVTEIMIKANSDTDDKGEWVIYRRQ